MELVSVFGNRKDFLALYAFRKWRAFVHYKHFLRRLLEVAVFKWRSVVKHHMLAALFIKKLRDAVIHRRISEVHKKMRQEALIKKALEKWRNVMKHNHFVRVCALLKWISTSVRECSICSSFINITDYNKLGCGHVFHFSCLYKYTTRHNGKACPCCRAALKKQ